MQSKATSVAEYLRELPTDRRAAIETVRSVILKNLDKGYAEGMSYGMIGYYVPHALYPPGYHCDPKVPLPFAALASQKNYMSVYILTVYSGCEDGESGDEDSRWFHEAWRATGKKLDMGKCCIRFKKIDDLALDVIGEAIRRFPVKRFIEHYETSLLAMNKDAAAKRAGAAKPKPGAKKGAMKKGTTKQAGKKVAKKAVAKRGTGGKATGKGSKRPVSRGRRG